MKQGETMEKRYRKYIVIMALCFIFGGFSLMFYLLQVYSVFWQTDMVSAIRNEGGNFTAPVFSHELRGNDIEGFNRSLPPGLSVADPSLLILSPFSLILLFTGIVSISGGFSIWNLIREREIKSTKKQLLDIFLLPEEKKVLNEIEKYGGSVTQSELVKTTGYTRVKVHRIIKNLENKKLIMKQQYGMTNKIVLKR
jgi:drug/metabolite transporter superfamily protein YnfA